MSATSSAIEHSPLDVELAVAQFTVDEYLGMIEVGAFDDVGRVELLEGYLVRKTTKNPPHALALGLLHDLLSAFVSDSWYVANQESIRLDNSVPEPDLMVVSGKRRDYADRHPEPADVAIVIEIADTSLRKDRRKAVTYARNRIPVYWIVNLIDDQVEVFENPVGSGMQAAYQTVHTYHRGDLVPCVIEGVSCPSTIVDDLMP